MKSDTIAISILTGVAITFLVLIGPLLGAFAGWVVGLFWGDEILKVLHAFGMKEGVSMWHLGAALGFIGGFFRSTLTTTN